MTSNGWNLVCIKDTHKQFLEIPNHSIFCLISIYFLEICIRMNIYIIYNNIIYKHVYIYGIYLPNSSPIKNQFLFDCFKDGSLGPAVLQPGPSALYS